MTNQEFAVITRELLTDTWGEKSYPKGVMEKLWRIVRDIPGADLREGLDNLSMTVSRAPNLGQIRAACLPALRRAQDAKRQERLKVLGAVACEWCGGSGWVSVVPKDNPLSEGSLICTKCEAAQVRGIQRQSGTKEARYWDDDLTDRFLVRKMTSDATRVALELQAAFLPKRSALAGHLSVADALSHIAKAVTAGKPIDPGEEDPF